MLNCSGVQAALQGLVWLHDKGRARPHHHTPWRCVQAADNIAAAVVLRALCCDVEEAPSVVPTGSKCSNTHGMGMVRVLPTWFVAQLCGMWHAHTGV